MTGSCCPVTTAHIGAFDAAKELLQDAACKKKWKNLEPFAEVLGLLSLNGDNYVAAKLKKNGETYIPSEQRAELVRLATGNHEWLDFNPVHEQRAVEALQTEWPNLRFIRYAMNGADDVLKYRKWVGCCKNRRFITMGRPGFTELVEQGALEDEVDLESGYFIIGPELKEISSTAVRKALTRGDTDSLEKLLHPEVSAWCMHAGPFQPSSWENFGCPGDTAQESGPQPSQRRICSCSLQ
eukprot:TRINITY_DN12239_c0_g1_i2.p1 TRINITY_DN12239_c0_g1~~TRINITY_DN12239_c0_g1_i2.p1  ORF type:complete len:256 (+),score=45.88 TRINITY_DN12239_c0_g1_i2:53-769(+)